MQQKIDKMTVEEIERNLKYNILLRKGIKRRGAFKWGIFTSLFLITFIINIGTQAKFPTVVIAIGLIISAFGIKSYLKILEKKQNEINLVNNYLRTLKDK